MKVLVVNAGSSSLKVSLLGDDDALLADADGTPGDLDDLLGKVCAAGSPDAVGHRVVQGGRRTSAVRLDAGVRQDLADLTDLAPLHQPPALEAIDATARRLPDVPAVACFDTTFHTTIPAAAATYALPATWSAADDLRRFGFHGLSAAYASRRVAELAGRDDLRLVVAHLGSGASLTAVAAGRSIDTTMGFTPVDGLVMATRSGAVDPGLLLWLQTARGHDAATMSDELERQAGILGLAGTKDMAAVVEHRDRPAEGLAFGVYLHRLRAELAGMVAALGGLDALVFTGGVGEHSAVLRAEACAGLGFLGIALDSAGNDGAGNAEVDGDVEITASGAAVRTWVVHAREDLQVAREVRSLLG